MRFLFYLSLIVLLTIGIGIVVATCFDGTPVEPETTTTEVFKVNKQSKPLTVKTAITPDKSVVPQKQTSISESAERERRRRMFASMTPDEKMEYLYNKIKETPLPDAPASNRVFRTGTEQVMSWIFSCELGSQPPLLPPMSLYDQAHLAEILLSDNVINDDDSDRARQAKETVQEVKKMFIDYVEDGGNPDDFLPYYHSQLVKAHDTWKEARAAIYQMVKTEPDIALEYARQVNKELEQEGIKPVVVPQKMLEAFGIEQDTY